MVTKEEFGQFIAEFESFRDFTLEELENLKTEMEKLKEDLNEIVKEMKIPIKKRIE